MKVYTKKVEGIAGPGLCFIIGLIFAGVPFGFFSYLAVVFFNHHDKFFDTFWNSIVLIFFALFFFVIGLMILYGVFKIPVKRIAKLSKKTKSEYNGQAITSMTFHLEDEKESYDYECYTKGDNDLTEGNDYTVVIKDSFDKIIKVLPYSSTNYLNSKISRRDFTEGFNIVTFGIGFVIAGPTVVIWIKSFFDILNNNYNNELTIPLIVMTVFSILVVVTSKKYSLNSNNNPVNDISNANKEKENTNVDVSKYPILKDDETIIENNPRKEILKEMLYMLIFWIFIEIFFILLFKIKLDIKGIKNILIMIGVMTYPLIFLELFKLIQFIKYYNFDDELIKEHNIKINNTISLDNIHFLNVIKLSSNLDIYCIIDDKRNLLYKVVRKTWNNTYNILDYNNKKVGEIKRKLTNLNSTYIISLVNKVPIVIEARYQINYNYNVYNTNYNIIGNYSDMEGYNGLQNIIRDNDQDIAFIQFFSSKKFLYRFKNAEIAIAENINNNEEIIFIAMSVILGNQERFDMEHNR